MIAQRNAPASEIRNDRLEEACEQYREELRGFFASRAPKADRVDDLVQLVYLRLLRSRPVELIDDPRLFMFRIAWNELRRENLRVQREKQRAVHLDPESLQRLSETTGSLSNDNSTEEIVREQLARVLRELPPAWQFAFLRQYRDRRSYKEISQEMGVSQHSVKSYIMKALNRFRAHFAAEDAEQEE